MTDKNQSAASLDEAAIAVHEVFLSYMRAGFTRKEALELVMQQLTAAQCDEQQRRREGEG
jgi:hypothetical protein